MTPNNSMRKLSFKAGFSIIIFFMLCSLLAEFPIVSIFFNKKALAGGDLFHFGIIFFGFFNIVAIFSAILGLTMAIVLAKHEPEEYSGFSSFAKLFFTFLLILSPIITLFARKIGDFW